MRGPLSSNDAFDNQFQSSSTIAAIVTPVGGPPGAVGIVRLSGDKAVEVAGRVFRSAKRRRKEEEEEEESDCSVDSWRPRSHFVEYGVVVDSKGSVVDEVGIEKFSPFFNSIDANNKKLETLYDMCTSVYVVVRLMDYSNVQEISR